MVLRASNTHQAQGSGGSSSQQQVLRGRRQKARHEGEWVEREASGRKGAEDGAEVSPVASRKASL